MKLTINGKEWNLIFGTAAFQILCDDLGLAIEDIDLAIMSNENMVLNRLVYAALKNGAECNYNEVDFSFNQFLNWLDEQPQETGKQIMDVFLASKMMGITMKQRYDDMIASIAKENGFTEPEVKKKNSKSAK